MKSRYVVEVKKGGTSINFLVNVPNLTIFDGISFSFDCFIDKQVSKGHQRS